MDLSPEWSVIEDRTKMIVKKALEGSTQVMPHVDRWLRDHAMHSVPQKDNLRSQVLAAIVPPIFWKVAYNLVRLPWILGCRVLRDPRVLIRGVANPGRALQYLQYLFWGR